MLLRHGGQLKVTNGTEPRTTHVPVINVVLSEEEARQLLSWFSDFAPVTEGSRVTKNAFREQLALAVGSNL